MTRFSAQAFVLAVVASLTAVSTAVPATGDDQTVRRILVVLQDESTLIASMDAARGVREALSDRGTTEFEVYTEYLDIVRFPAPDHVRLLSDYLVDKFETVPLDAVVALGPRALRFMIENRRRIAPDAPLVFGDVSERTLEQIQLPDDAWGVVTPYDVGKTVDLALRLRPEATRIAVVTGSAEFDRYWQESARLTLGDRYRDVPIEYLSGLTLDGFLAEAGKLPADAILLVLTVFEDADGRKFRPLEVRRGDRSGVGSARLWHSEYLCRIGIRGRRYTNVCVYGRGGGGACGDARIGRQVAAPDYLRNEPAADRLASVEALGP
jgi:hypothetical protein